MNRLTPAELDRIRALHARGLSCRAIAKDIRRSTNAVANNARAMGLAFDASRTAAATEAKQASNRERRAALVHRLYDRADAIMTRLEADQFKVTATDTHGNAVTTPVAADAIPGHEERALTGMVVNLLAGAARLEAVDAGHTGDAQARGILGALQDSLQAAYGQLAHTGGTATAEAIERELDGE